MTRLSASFRRVGRSGALIGLIETVPQDDELLIVNVAVAPEQQGQGYGSC
jgi:ribosomal protein S18 acetylase RimI-like enzyme